MGFCIWGLSWLSCGIVSIFKAIFGFFLPGIPSSVFFFVALAISSISIYLLGIFLGRTGGILLTVVGIVGALFSAGTTLILSLIGILMIFFGKPQLLVLLNLGLFALCATCYGIG
ncbi:MAG TPA: hypothetical protein VJ343_01855 [archaeon]|nr:hypothetical protein [archaeon]